MSSLPQTFPTTTPTLNPTPDNIEGGAPFSSIPLKCYAKVIPNTEKVGFNSQAKRFQYPEVAVDLCKQNYKLGAKSVFSSKTKRTMSCSSKEPVPSPCHYRIKDSLIRVSPPVLVSCFRSKTGRTIDPETLSPGPAAYQQAVETPIGPSKRFSGLRKCVLNFSAPAIPPPQNPPLPGPGQYDIVDYRGPPKHYISSAVFVSNTKRWTGDKFHKGIPGPGENITAIKCPYSKPDSHPFEKKNESEAQKRPAGWLERPRASEKENQNGRLTKGNYRHIIRVSGYLQGMVKKVKMAALM
ncbi:PREDICTED: O(6)-methylguanine-induced apoptosis 2, partial [Thamnophis sirtalis]|uniref:O(6)-methylguanine-induced apoptosis 2 n=1 Tax=Thamnophis sirtalis TaxID=35019 RepID=A0A6I9Z3X9_9SAUR